MLLNISVHILSLQNTHTHIYIYTLEVMLNICELIVDINGWFCYKGKILLKHRYVVQFYKNYK
jgi:hypothetical protein